MASSRKLRRGSRSTGVPKGLSSKVREAQKTSAVRKKSEARKPRQHSEKPANQLLVQRLVAMIGFGLCGGLLGFLTGANQLAPAPPEIEHVLGQISWGGAVLGLQGLNWIQGINGAFLGLVVGSTGGFSFFMAPLTMLASWITGGLGLGLLIHWGAAAGAIGWMLGYAPFLVREWQQQARG